MSLRSAPERTREGGRRRSARDVTTVARRSCAASKPAETPRLARWCDGAAAPAQMIRPDFAPEVPVAAATNTLIRGGVGRPRRLPSERQGFILSWTNRRLAQDISR